MNSSDESNEPAGTGPIQCTIVTPETTVLDVRCDGVVMPLYDGQKGVAKNHSPMIGRLGYGELRIRSGSEIERFYVDGGFVQIAANIVTVLTNRAISADQLEPNELDQQLQEVMSTASAGDEELGIRDRKVAQLRGQLRVAK